MSLFDLNVAIDENNIKYYRLYAFVFEKFNKIK